MEDKINYWGTLDVAARTLESIPAEFKKLYDGGRYRMRPEDIRRMGIYLRRIARSKKQVAEVLNNFKQLV